MINIQDYLIFTNADIHKEINTIQQLLEKMINVTYLKKNGGPAKCQNNMKIFQKQLIIRKVFTSS